MTKITKLPNDWRSIIPKEHDGGDLVWTAAVITGMEHAADQLEVALPTWTKITDQEDTWPPIDSEVMYASWYDGWNIANGWVEFTSLDDMGDYWRPLCDLDCPPKDES